MAPGPSGKRSSAASVKAVAPSACSSDDTGIDTANGIANDTANDIAKGIANGEKNIIPTFEVKLYWSDDTEITSWLKSDLITSCMYQMIKHSTDCG